MGQQGNVLQVFEDMPMQYDADIDIYYGEKQEIVDFIESTVEETAGPRPAPAPVIPRLDDHPAHHAPRGELRHRLPHGASIGTRSRPCC